MATQLELSAIIGTIVHTLKFGKLTIVEDGAIIFEANGTIRKILDFKVDSRDLGGIPLSNVKDYTGCLVMPGFIDAHCHAPQVYRLSQMRYY